jgi:prepilin-type processing-associated H-X9-DG protein
MTAVILYANENKLSLPFSNSIEMETPPGVNGILWPGPGWLYAAPNRTHEDDLKAGVLWPYLKKAEIYRCPDDLPPFKSGCPHEMSSYMMNNAVCGFNRVRPYKLSKMKAHWVCLVEADQSDPSSEPTWDDGCVDPEDGNSDRHKGGSNFACFDAHVEWMSQIEYDNETDRKPGRLYCNPGRAKGD